MLVPAFGTKKANLTMWYLQHEPSSGFIHIYKNGKRLRSRVRNTLADPILKVATREKDGTPYVVVRTKECVIRTVIAGGFFSITTAIICAINPCSLRSLGITSQQHSL